MKKIMFNDKYGLTKAVLEGRKPMTRRAVSKQVCEKANAYRKEYFLDTLDALSEEDALLDFSPFKVGEVVAVAQSYKEIHETEAICPNEFFNRDYYKQTKGWTNKMFVLANLMHHHIRITNVRVERLQDISDEDCIREGIYEVPFCEYSWEDNGARFGTPREAFAALIDKVSGNGTWESNPWVFVYEFELVK